MRRNLTPSQEHYLEHIYHLTSQKGPVRMREIAEAVGVRLPSVTRAVARLAEAGMVSHEVYGTVEITERGAESARAVQRRDDCLTSLLVDILGIEPDTAKTEVCRIEHVLGSDVLSRLEILVGHARSKQSADWLRALRRNLRSFQARRREAGEKIVGNVNLHAGKPLE